MRALCGSIIAAGALIGLGLTAVGYGVRFQGVMVEHTDTQRALWGTPSLTIILVVLIAAVLIGLGIAFLGLAYHHERRHRERLHHDTMASPGARVGV
jgi:hypothetical protein